jgi:hypothetical protein
VYEPSSLAGLQLGSLSVEDSGCEPCGHVTGSTAGTTPALAGIGALGDGLFEWFRKWLAGEGFDQAVYEVHARMRSKYYPWYCNAVFQLVYKCLSYESVRRVLASYMSNVIEGKCAEYVKPRSTPWSEATKKTVLLTAQRAAVYQWFTVYALNELYDGTMNGDIIDPSTLRPLTAPREAVATPSSAASLDNSSDVFDLLKWGGIAVITVAGLYGVTRLIDTVDRAKN